jgi:hypothetical protein
MSPRTIQTALLYTYILKLYATLHQNVHVYIWEMLATTQFRIYNFHVFYLKISRLKCTNWYVCLLLCMSMKNFVLS